MMLNATYRAAGRRLSRDAPGSRERMQAGDLERSEEEAAAAEAAAIGGRTSDEPAPIDGAPDAAQRPLEEAGQGEAEGFEQAERDLIEHASHGDQHAARQTIEDARE